MKLIAIFLFLFRTVLTFAQESSEGKIVDNFIKRHNSKMDTVFWLCQYDDIAWWTSDSVYATPKEEQAKLGSEWFCFQKNGIWHAVYGRYKDDRFEMSYHYEVDTNAAIRRVATQIDTLTLNSNARALVNGRKQLDAYPGALKVRFNQYIRRNPDRTLSVWLLPAFTTNGIAVYGGEFYYLFDSTGNKLISKTEYSQSYKGLKPDSQKEVWLDYESVDEPTLGSIFFIWYYRKYFKRIVVDAKKFKSTLFNDNEKGYYWVHAVK